MTRLKLASAAAMITTLIAAPAIAQDVPVRAQVVNHANDWSVRHHRYYHGSGFWPGDVAAGIVGGAIGTAGAIATAPFRAFDDRHAYNTYYNGYDQFACAPGTTFIGEDGLRHICQ